MIQKSPLDAAKLVNVPETARALSAMASDKPEAAEPRPYGFRKREIERARQVAAEEETLP